MDGVPYRVFDWSPIEWALPIGEQIVTVITPIELPADVTEPEQVTDELEAVDEIRIEAEEALEAARLNGVAEETLLQAEEMIAAGIRYYDIVKVGNGVHNKKYAIIILDEAFINFEDTIDLLESGG